MISAIRFMFASNKSDMVYFGLNSIFSHFGPFLLIWKQDFQIISKSSVLFGQ